MSRLLRPAFYAAVPSIEKDVAASNEMKYLHRKDHFHASPLALITYALIIAVCSAIGGLGIGMSLKESEDTIPSWTRSLSRGTQENLDAELPILQE